jgi:DNA-binding CsgD family transcriptional regulator
MRFLERARRQCSAIAEVALASAEIGEMRARVLAPLREAVPFDSAYWGELAPMARTAAADGGVSVDAEVFGARERRRLRVPDEVLAPQGITSLLHIYLPVPGRELTFICLARHGRSRAFGPSDVASARLLVPTLLLAEALCGARDSRTLLPAPVRVNGAGLSARERQIVGLVARGLRNRDVADECGTSVHTVRKQLANVFAKLGVASRTELAARFALEREPTGLAPGSR